jgi:excisionase family DNA binding protein
MDPESKYDRCYRAKCKREGVAVSTPLLDADQAAAYLSVEPATLAIWRSTKRYPLRYIKVGRHVRYRKSDLDAFLDKRTVTFLP